jgi:hypothetical protein
VLPPIANTPYRGLGVAIERVEAKGLGADAPPRQYITRTMATVDPSAVKTGVLHFFRRFPPSPYRTTSDDIVYDHSSNYYSIMRCMSLDPCYEGTWVAGVSLPRKRRRELHSLAEQAASDSFLDSISVSPPSFSFRQFLTMMGGLRRPLPWTESVFVRSVSPTRVGAALSATRPDVIVTNLPTALSIGQALRGRLGSDSVFRHVATIVMIPPNDSAASEQCAALGVTQCVSTVSSFRYQLDRAYAQQERRVRHPAAPRANVCRGTPRECVLFAL